MFRQLRKIATAYEFSLAHPWKDIPKEAQTFILKGADAVESPPRIKGKFSFDGVNAFIEDSYHNSSSDKIKSWAESFMRISVCPSCDGARLKKESLHFKIAGKNISDLAEMDIATLGRWLDELPDMLSERQKQIGTEVLKEIRKRVGFLLEVGLDYLALNRPAKTLSGGEAQRIRLATQIGSQLVGVLYILDEPSIGLHQRDNRKLINSLLKLRDLGNTVLVVEHDKDMMLDSDYIIDFGPGAGIHGGHVVAEGTPSEVLKSGSETAAYLNGKKEIEIPKERRKPYKEKLILKGAKGNNLKDVALELPLGVFVCVTGGFRIRKVNPDQ